MSQRQARVAAVTDDAIELEVAARCDGCDCSGACGAFAGAAVPTLTVARTSVTFVPCVGQAVRVSVADDAVRAGAAVAYGAPLAGLVGGAALGSALAPLAGVAPDLGAVAGAGSGTWLAWVAVRAYERRRSPPALSVQLVGS